MKRSLFRLGSFKAKLVALILGVTFISLLAASVGLAVVQIKGFRDNLAASTASNAAILSFNLVPALLFDDADSALQLLSSLKTLPHVKEANAYNIDEQGDLVLMASYPEQKFAGGLDELKSFITPVFQGINYQLTYPIMLEADVLGYLYVRSEFLELESFQLKIFGIVSAIMTACLLMALVISLKFQAILLLPLSKMVLITRKISVNKDYSLRIDESANDEFRDLAMSFNHMLEVTQQHHRRQQMIEDEIRQLNLDLEDKVGVRTHALEQANSNLQSTLDQLNSSQKQLVEREKMASLGGLVAGISHEVNTPIGVGVTAISHLSELLKQLQSKYESKTLSPRDLVYYMENAREGVDITSSNLFRAADLVKSFKQVAVDQSSDNIRVLHVNHYLHEILMSLRPQLKRVAHQVEVDCDEHLIIQCNAGALSQIVTNFIMNSLIHAFDGIEQGHMKISIKRLDQEIELIYTDDGNGMPDESLKRIFEPFFTTRRNQGGSGLGTHLIYNLVTQALNGTIFASAGVDGGLRFDIRFPEGEAA